MIVPRQKVFYAKIHWADAIPVKDILDGRLGPRTCAYLKQYGGIYWFRTKVEREVQGLIFTSREQETVDAYIGITDTCFETRFYQHLSTPSIVGDAMIRLVRSSCNPYVLCGTMEVTNARPQKAKRKRILESVEKHLILSCNPFYNTKETVVTDIQETVVVSNVGRIPGNLDRKFTAKRGVYRAEFV